jgi:hypothetical protein
MKRISLSLSLVIILIMLIAGSVVSAQDEESVGVPNAVIEEYPAPNVTQLYANADLINDRVYRRVVGNVETYDAPNGNPAGAIGAGFNFVTVLRFADGWAEIREGRWVRETDLITDVALSTFGGVLLPEEGLPFPVAWVLVYTRASRVPGGEPSDANPTLYRYQVVNIYDTVELGGWNWYQIGVDQWIHQTLVARILPVERTDEIDTDKWVSVDLYEQVAIAYEGDTPVFATLASSGLAGWETNEGLFHIYVRYERALMSGSDGLPDFYYLEEVPWTMYFDDDIALHGAYWHDGFGYRRSHGCVNLSITDANWLYNFASSEFDFTVEGDLGAAVYVYSSGDYS